MTLTFNIPERAIKKAVEDIKQNYIEKSALDDIKAEIEDVIKRYKGSCDQELGIKWGYEGALEIIDEHIGKENNADTDVDK